ncbi:MAG: DegT/DnrJ/EryC1/StrS family aminotransferase [Candidatus Levybacteria bacterium]|nr:DegT/DnrJ/EryC1/StrS family aminotransferase [Candidatus Levybacteria bacterium]
MITITKTFLPPLEEYYSYLKGIWDRNQVTNHGPLVSDLEKKLRDYFQVKHLFLVTNGTIGLQIAIKAAHLKGEVLTTPFSYVATTSSIAWQGCVPVFVDIDPDTWNIDTRKIESHMSSKTSAIVATHVFGNPCDVEALESLAAQYKLTLIYDAAHCFGITYRGRSVLSFGNIAVLSLHATKLFHTIEGGAIITNDDETAHIISYMRNFGHDGEERFFGLGINGKMSEMHAAMGLCILPKLPSLISRRKKITKLYESLLDNAPLGKQRMSKGTEYNYSYLPRIFQSERQMLKVRDALRAMDIHARRYFYPSLNRLYYTARQQMPIAEDIAKRILCLPIHHDLSDEQVYTIAKIVKSKLV